MDETKKIKNTFENFFKQIDPEAAVSVQAIKDGTATMALIEKTFTVSEILKLKITELCK